MREQSEFSSAAKPVGFSKLGSILGWVVSVAILVLIVVYIGVLIYGSAPKPGWAGFTGKKVWDYLDVFLVPIAVAVATARLTWEQYRRQSKDAAAQQEQQRKAEESQRA